MFPYEWALHFLKQSLCQQLPPDLRAAVVEIVCLHLDSANYRMPGEYDPAALRRPLAAGCRAKDVRQLIVFEPTETMLGVARVMVRTHLNRQGVGRVSRGGSDRTLSPRVLGIFGTATEFQGDLCNFRHLVETWYEVVCALRNDTELARRCDETDVEALDSLRRLGNDLVARIEEHDLTPNQLMRACPNINKADNWCKVVLGVHSGLRYLKRAFSLDAARVWAELTSIDGFAAVVRITGAARSAIYGYGQPLAQSFFADLGACHFCKPDTHVLKCVAAIRGRSTSQRDAVDYVFGASEDLSTGERKISPREIDKIMFFGCSGRWPLLGSGKLPGWSQTGNEFLAGLRSREKIT